MVVHHDIPIEVHDQMDKQELIDVLRVLVIGDENRLKEEVNDDNNIML